MLAGGFWIGMKKNKKQKQQLQKALEQEKQMHQTAVIKGNQQEESIKSLSEGLMHFLSISIDSIYELGAMRHTVLNKIRSKEIDQLAALRHCLHPTVSGFSETGKCVAQGRL